MKICKSECNYQVTECDLKFGEQITLDDELLISVSILDKIRVEIEKIIGEHNLDDYDYCSGLICARKIIDKYRNEVNHEADN